MSEGQKFRLDVDHINHLRKRKSIPLKEMADLFTQEMSVSDVKDIIYGHKRAGVETIEDLAMILECEPAELIAPGEIIVKNVPFEVLALVKGLYKREKEDIQPIYAAKLEDFQYAHCLKSMIGQTHELFVKTAEADIYVDRKWIETSIAIITTRFKAENCLSNRETTGLYAQDVERFYQVFDDHSGTYHPHQLFLLFSYIFILFEAIFLEELTASAMQEIRERAGQKKMLEYFKLTKDCQDMRDTLFDKALYNREEDWLFTGEHDNLTIEDTGLDTVLIDGIILLLAACEMCRSHLESDWTSSEGVNRATFGALIKNLQKRFNRLRIDIKQSNFMETATSRFAASYYWFRNMVAVTKSRKNANFLQQVQQCIQTKIQCDFYNSMFTGKK